MEYLQRSYTNEKHMKRFSASLAICEMEVKATIRYFFIFTGMARIKTHKHAHIQKITSVVRMWRNWNPYILLEGV